MKKKILIKIQDDQRNVNENLQFPVCCSFCCCAENVDLIVDEVVFCLLEAFAAWVPWYTKCCS